MDFTLNLSSLRAHRARYKNALSSKWLNLALIAVVSASLFSGLYLLLSDSKLGWLALLPGSLAVMLWLWRKGDLEQTDYGQFQAGTRILLHEALEMNTLGRLKKKGGDGLSAYELWKALEPSEERYFIGNRYLLDASFFENLLSKDPGSAAQVWEHAKVLRDKHVADGFTNMLVFVALVSSVPNVEQLLTRIQLSLGDIETSIPWMRDIKEKRELVKLKKKLGRIGRDWAYGYTPILGRLGHNISGSIEKHGFFSDTRMHESIVEQIIQNLANNNAVALVGETGVGKTTSVYALAERLLADSRQPRQIRYNQVVEMDASSLIANAKRPGELEDLMIHILNEAHRAKNIILFFDEASVFFGAGTGQVDLSHVLQPAIDSGSVRLIFALTPENWQQLSRTGIAARLKSVVVPPADRENTLAVLRDQIGTIEYRHNATFTYQALNEGFKLGGRYETTQAMPGAALKILEQAVTASPEKFITREVVQAGVEQAYGIKLQTAQGSQESADLLQLEDKLRQYVISQDRAVTVVANALRRARSGVGNPDRPIGTFLFLGPTGVGKTELSKALARTYFGDEKAMIRVDMNQFVQSNDVQRLIKPMVGNELGFLGQVRKQPFSVILLDEIEKADTSVKNALLQMLDEGVMRDTDNKPVSFKDAIIIATSNAGADEIRRFIEEGKDITELEGTFVDTLISRGDFAPEFVNRFDEVVLFKPLAPDDLTQVIDLIIASINKTLDSQKVQVVLTPEAKRWLVDKGYDAKLGARPMRRMAQRYVENLVAKKLLEGSLQSGGTLNLDVPDFEQSN